MKRLFVPFFTFILIALSSNGNTEDVKWETMTDDKILRSIFVEKSELKDPFSVQFRMVQVTNKGPNKDQIWCGEVNAKNSFGAYGGWKRFWAYSLTGETIISIDSSEFGPEMFLVLFKEVCAGSEVMK